MPFLSLSDETHKILSRLRVKGETDEALIKRIVEYAESFMVIYGMTDEKANP